MNKIQVGPNVWIRPNLWQSVPEYGENYWYVIKNPHSESVVDFLIWGASSIDFAFLNSGNFFITREAAEQAIIKPVDPTPITYKQWVDAGRPNVWWITSESKISFHHIYSDVEPIYFAANKRWLTREAAQAWRDQWEKENGEVK